MARTPESAAVDFAESSLFTGRFSILALAACGVGFSLSGRLPAAIFSLAAAAVAAAARLWARHVLDGVNAALQAERSCVFPGEPCPLRVTLDNPKWLPLVWLTVRFPLEPGGALRPEHRWETVELPEGGVQKPYYEKNVSFLLGHQRMSYTSRLQAEHRGLLSFDRIRLLSGDGLCLCVREKEIPLPRPVTLAVFPRLVPVSTRWFLRNSWELETGARGFQDDRTVIRNVRAYQPGDNARSLNFRLMARGQGAMVNIYEKISPRRAAFLLDGASFAGLPPEDFESALEDPGLPGGAADGRGGGRVSAHLPPRRAAGAVCHLPGPAAASRSPDAAGRRRHRCLHYGGRDPAAPPHPLRRLSDLRGCPPPGRRYLCAAGAAPRPPAGLGGTVSPPPAGPGPECFSGRRRPMRHGKTTALKCLPLATELLIVFLTADILWQLLCGRPPFSMWGFLLSGGLMTAGNSLFLQKPRRFWQILLLNVLLCAVWIPLLSRTLDLTYPPLLVIQVPLYLFPLCRGYHWGVTPVTVRHLHGAGEYMGLYGLFYLIVASFAPQLLDRVPVLLALLALDAAGSGGDAHLRPQHHSGRFSLRAASGSAGPSGPGRAGCGRLRSAAGRQGELIPIFQAVGSLLEGALIAVFRFLTSLFQGRSAGSAGMSSAAGGGSEAALPVESASGPAIAPQLVTALLLLSLAALVLAGVAALVRWLWRSRSRIRLPEEDDDDGLVRQRLGRRGLLSRLGQRLRVRAFLLRYAGTPRAALLELEHWGARRRCRRQSQETPREYLERLAGGPLRDALDAPMQARYSILVDDVERSLYSTLPPRLSREQVRELLSTVHRSARTPPARAK